MCHQLDIKPKRHAKTTFIFLIIGIDMQNIPVHNEQSGIHVI